MKWTRRSAQAFSHNSGTSHSGHGESHRNETLYLNACTQVRSPVLVGSAEETEAVCFLVSRVRGTSSPRGNKEPSHGTAVPSTTAHRHSSILVRQRIVSSPTFSQFFFSAELASSRGATYQNYRSAPVAAAKGKAEGNNQHSCTASNPNAEFVCPYTCWSAHLLAAPKGSRLGDRRANRTPSEISSNG